MNDYYIFVLNDIDLLILELHQHSLQHEGNFPEKIYIFTTFQIKWTKGRDKYHKKSIFTREMYSTKFL